MSETIIGTKSILNAAYTSHTLVKSNQTYDSTNGRYNITGINGNFFIHRAVALKSSNRWFLPSFDLQLIAYIRKNFGKAENFQVGVAHTLTSTNETSLSLYEQGFSDTVDVYVFD